MPQQQPLSEHQKDQWAGGGFKEADQWAPTPHTGFHLHTRHTDSTVACLTLHNTEHTQLHLLFCTNNYCTELHSKTLPVYINVSQYKSYIHTSLSLETTVYYVYIMEMWVLYIVYNCLLCKCVYCCLCILCIFHILLLVLPWHGRVLYLRISSSIHLCTWCVTKKIWFDQT